MTGVRVRHPRCPYCHEDVAVDAEKTACNRCMGWHHDACWTALGRCGACAAAEPLRFRLGEGSDTSLCPRCDHRLASYDEPFELLLCGTCWAFWAPAASLGQLLIGVGGDPHAAVDERARVERNVSCFVCGADCQKGVWGDLILDVCPGHGVWFDAGELVVLRARIEQRPQEGLALLSQILGDEEAGDRG